MRPSFRAALDILPLVNSIAFSINCFSSPSRLNSLLNSSSTTKLSCFIDLVEEGVDVAFRIGNICPQNWVSRPLIESTFSLCASEDYLQRRGVPNHPEELYEHTLIVPRQTSTWDFDGPKGENVHIDCVARLKVDELKLAARAAESGLGIVNLPDYVVFKALEEGRLKRLMPNWKSRSRKVHMLYQERKYIPAKVRLFIEFVMTRFQTLESFKNS